MITTEFDHVTKRSDRTLPVDGLESTTPSLSVDAATPPTGHLGSLRADFEAQAGRSLSLPIAGALVWAIVAVAALLVPDRIATMVLVVGSGAIFPLGLLIARALGERLMNNDSPLAALMGMSVLMVNLLWAVHLTLFSIDVQLVPLTLAIGLGLHWIVFSWVIGHPLGVIHTVARTVLVTAAWWLLPDNRIEAIAFGVVITYVYAILALATRRRGSSTVADLMEAAPRRG
ncbi:MAG: hypothetical protein H0U69_14330 [Trueperaceae bacterium]|nr:hypothetical protein [Trueperaceae bacterium]